MSPFLYRRSKFIRFCNPVFKKPSKSTRVCAELASLDMMEPGFLEYLYTFLHDEGLPYLAETVNLGSLTCKLYDLVLDFKRCLNPKLYQKLWDNSFYYSPPYLVLCTFNEKPNRRC